MKLTKPHQPIFGPTKEVTQVQEWQGPMGMVG